MEDTDNLLLGYTKEDASALASRIIDSTRADLKDREEWDAKCEIWTKLWACEPPDRTNPSFDDGANVCTPIVASAVEQFHNRAFSAFFDQPSQNQIEAKPVAVNDIDRAIRVGKYMNWQLSEEVEEFEPEHDRLLQSLAKDGVAWKKWWWDDEEKRPACMFCPGSEIVVPYGTRPFQAHKGRITHKYEQSPARIQELIESGFYHLIDEDLAKKIDEAEVVAGERESIIDGGSRSSEDISPAQEASDSIMGHEPTEPESEMHWIFERHEKMFVKKDDEKPTHVTVYVDSYDERVLRIESRQDGKKVIHQFIDYHFIWSPYGFYSYGYGHFLSGLNFITNQCFNLNIDSALLCNTPYMLHSRGAGLRQKTIRLRPGDSVEVRDITQVRLEKMTGLDGSLGQILQQADKYGSDMSDNTEEARGRVQKGVREPTARGQQGRLEQTLMGFGVKVRRAIKSTKREFQVLYLLNSMYQDEDKEHRVLGSTDETAFNRVDKEDWDKKLDVIPTASPGYAARGQLRQEQLEVNELLLKHPSVGPNPVTGQIGNADLLNAALKKLLETYGMGELTGYIKAPPAPPLEPGMEHQSWLEDTVPPVSEAENVVEHLTAHRRFYEMNAHLLTPETRVKVLKHIDETQHLLAARQQMAMAPPQPQGPPQQPQAAPAQPPGRPGAIGGPGASADIPTDFSGEQPLPGVQ